ncbi:hypothetical protein GMMP15_500005 [Candidatus Magnetomoraceae bacterium gMMP-15]
MSWNARKKSREYESHTFFCKITPGKDIVWEALDDQLRLDSLKESQYKGTVI